MGHILDPKIKIDISICNYPEIKYLHSIKYPLFSFYLLPHVLNLISAGGRGKVILFSCIDNYTKFINLSSVEDPGDLKIPDPTGYGSGSGYVFDV